MYVDEWYATCRENTWFRTKEASTCSEFCICPPAARPRCQVCMARDGSPRPTVWNVPQHRYDSHNQLDCALSSIARIPIADHRSPFHAAAKKAKLDDNRLEKRMTVEDHLTMPPRVNPDPRGAQLRAPTASSKPALPLESSTFTPQHNAPQHPNDDADLPKRPPISPITPTTTFADVRTAAEVSPFSLDGASDTRQSSAAQRPSSRSTTTAPFAWPQKPLPNAYPPALPNASTSRDRSPRRQPPNLPAGPPAHEPQYIPQPPPLPLDLDSNPDAIALKAAISVLRLQQQKSRRDIQTLRKIKDAALEDPTSFVEDLRSGRLTSPPLPRDPLAATLAGPDDEDSDEDMAEPETTDVVAGEEQEQRLGTIKNQPSNASKFPTIPTPQNIVRCPPINWSKYHIVGEPLDRMHEEQRRRPDLGEPWQESPREALVAAPYSPWRDRPTGRSGGSSGIGDAGPGSVAALNQQPHGGVQTRRSLGKPG